MVFSLVYVSAETAPLTQLDLRRLLSQSRRANQVTEITGLLLHRDGGFLQFLEGDQTHVENLFDAITRDDRHRDIITVHTRTQPARQFPDWQMAFGSPADPVRQGDIFRLTLTPDPTVPAPQTDTEARLVRDLLDLFDNP